MSIKHQGHFAAICGWLLWLLSAGTPLGDSGYSSGPGPGLEGCSQPVLEYNRVQPRGREPWCVTWLGKALAFLLL